MHENGRNLKSCKLLRSGIEAVVLSGGVFQNALLTTLTVAALEREGFRVYRHRRVPPGDGGLSLGQVAVAAASCMGGVRSSNTEPDGFVNPLLRSS